MKPVLKRGALVAAANWQVTLIQAAADSIFKLLIATPVIGGLFLVGLVIGTAPAELMGLEWREMAATIITSLLSHPAVLTAFLASLAVVVVGGSLFIFLMLRLLPGDVPLAHPRQLQVRVGPVHGKNDTMSGNTTKTG